MIYLNSPERTLKSERQTFHKLWVALFERHQVCGLHYFSLCSRGLREDEKQLVSIFCEGTHHILKDNDQAFPSTFFSRVNSKELVVFAQVTMYFKRIRGYTA